MSWLKADLHLHTREAEPFIAFDAYGLIDRAAREGFQVLSITNHDTLTFSDRLAAYARARGILLIPGAEATIEGRHVLLYNIDVPLSAIGTFARLRQFKGPDWILHLTLLTERDSARHQQPQARGGCDQLLEDAADSRNLFNVVDR